LPSPKCDLNHDEMPLYVKSNCTGQTALG